MPSLEELQLLNHILEKKDLNSVLDKGICAEHFTVHQDIFKYVVDFVKNNKTTPTTDTVLNKFDDFKLVELEKLDVVSQALREDYAYRKFKPTLKEVSELLGNNDTIKALEILKKTSEELLKGNSVSIGYSYKANAEKRRKDYLKIHNNSSKIMGITTGFKELDDATNGLEYMDNAVDYFLVFAPTNMGKSLLTSFMLFQGWEVLENDYPAYFSLEQSPTEIALNWDNIYASVSRLGMTRGSLTDEQKDRYIDKLDKLKEKSKDIVIYGLESNGGRPFTVQDIRRVLEKEGHTRFVLDQLSKVRTNNNSHDIRHRLYDVSSQIREMILDTKKPAFVIAQANRDALKRVKKDTSAEVDGGDIGDAFSILQDCSKGVSIVKIDNNTFRVTVIKNRNNGVGQSLLIRYDFDTGLVTPLDVNGGERFI